MYRLPKFKNPYHWSAHHELHESRKEHLMEVIGAKKDEGEFGGALPRKHPQKVFGVPRIKRRY